MNGMPLPSVRALLKRLSPIDSPAHDRVPASQSAMIPSLTFIHRSIPGSEDRSIPLLLLLHGTGGNEDDLLELGRSLYPGAPLFSPRGKILENGMPRFFRRLAEGVFDEPDLILRTHELSDFVQEAMQHPALSGRRVVAVGYSNGGNIAASILLLRPELFAGAVLLRSMLPLIPAALPDLSAVRVFLSNGRLDPMIPVPSAERLAAMLREAGADVSAHWSDSGHQLGPAEIADAQRWLASHFPSRETH